MCFPGKPHENTPLFVTVFTPLYPHVTPNAKLAQLTVGLFFHSFYPKVGPVHTHPVAPDNQPRLPRDADSPLNPERLNNPVNLRNHLVAIFVRCGVPSLPQCFFPRSAEPSPVVCCLPVTLAVTSRLLLDPEVFQHGWRKVVASQACVQPRGQQQQHGQ